MCITQRGTVHPFLLPSLSSQNSSSSPELQSRRHSSACDTNPVVRKTHPCTSPSRGNSTTYRFELVQQQQGWPSYVLEILLVCLSTQANNGRGNNPVKLVAKHYLIVEHCSVYWSGFRPLTIRSRPYSSYATKLNYFT